MPDTSKWLSRLTSARENAAVPAAAAPRPRPAPETRTDPAGAVPWAVRATAAWSWRLLVIAAAGIVIGYAVITFQIIFVAVLAAILVAVLLEPVATWLRRVLHFPRALASLAAILGTLAVIAGLLVLVGRSIYDGFDALAESALAGFAELQVWLTDGPLGLDDAQIEGWIAQATDQIQANSDVLVSGVANVTGSVTSVVTGAVITVFVLFFFLKEGRSIWQWFVRLVPRGARVRINEAGIRGWVTLGGYARTQILVAFVDAVGIALGALILGIPLALPIGVLVFLFSFIPIVGAFISGAVAVLVALVDQGPGTALIMLGVVLLVQQIEGNVLQPWLQGNALALHPIAILLAVTAGTGIAGILGALFAVPIVAVINTVMLYFTGHDKYPHLATDINRPGGPPGALEAAISASWHKETENDGVVVDDGPPTPTPDGEDDDPAATLPDATARPTASARAVGPAGPEDGEGR
ncbi:AI-2E family transporter [Georgenia yuyongxinii]|uniref:AI-2E family transporter n=1 Tax=Georgenia yuyongxinii TaxID=2589797 RepID=A0A552WLZ7_9MICO|nr:AI-2E family transporter [Georgenia yuyongxinii]TRW43777.1 AI-2E family transporter [Georgenia yuyongxinii]